VQECKSSLLPVFGQSQVKSLSRCSCPHYPILYAYRLSLLLNYVLHFYVCRLQNISYLFETENLHARFMFLTKYNITNSQKGRNGERNE
jgi:hypothetical protein